MTTKTSPNKKCSKKEINDLPKYIKEYDPPHIPEKLLKSKTFDDSEKGILKCIINPLGKDDEIDSNAFYQLLQKLAQYYEEKNMHNSFFYDLTYGLILYLITSTSCESYLNSFIFLIQREDVQLKIFQNRNNLYHFYAVIFNYIKCKSFQHEFIEVSYQTKALPDVSTFWIKFYNFLYVNCVEKKPKLKAGPRQYSTFVGKEYLEDMSEKLTFFALMAKKSFCKPRDISYMYDLIFLGIIYHEFSSYDFYNILLQTPDNEGATDALIKYITQNIQFRCENVKQKDLPLCDPDFPAKIILLFESITKNPSSLNSDYAYYLAKSCVPLISNKKIFIYGQDKVFDKLVISIVNILKPERQGKFFSYLFSCFKPSKSDFHIFKNKAHEFNSDLRPPLDIAVNFIKDFKSEIDQQIIANLTFYLFKEISSIQLERLKPLITTYLEMYPDSRSSYISTLEVLFWNDLKWNRKYKNAIQKKAKLNKDVANDLNTYLEDLFANVQDHTPNSTLPSDSNQTQNSNQVQDSNQTQNSNQAQESNLSTSSNLPIQFQNNDSSNNNLSDVTYDLIFQGKENNNHLKITFSKKVSIKKALCRIAAIGIYGSDLEKEEKEEEKDNQPQTDQSSVEIEESDLDDDDDSTYHTMQRGRSSYFCKEGMLFGHEKISADKSSREPVEVFGLSNYVDRSLPFNSLTFPKNILYVRLVPIKLLSLTPTISLGNIKLPSNDGTNDSHNNNNDDNSVFEQLDQDEMGKLAKINGKYPSKNDVNLFIQLNKDLNAFKQYKLEHRKTKSSKKKKS